MSDELTLFHNDCEWVVAKSPDDANAVLIEHYGGGTVADLSEATRDWQPWGVNRVLNIKEDEGTTSLTGAEWAARGRGYVGSTEF